MTLSGTQSEIKLRIDRNCPGAFLWRLQSTPNGAPREELISEGAPYQVFDTAFYFGVRNQKPCIFSHADLQALEGAYLLLDRGPKMAQELKFVFEAPGLIISHADADYASINFFVYAGEGRPGNGLSFSTWIEDGKAQCSFLGGMQQRVIDHIRGIQQMICHAGGVFRV